MFYLGGELFCYRKFCRFCLKQNYDLNLSEILCKPDYICPFCQVFRKNFTWGETYFKKTFFIYLIRAFAIALGVSAMI